MTLYYLDVYVFYSNGHKLGACSTIKIIGRATALLGLLREDFFAYLRWWISQKLRTDFLLISFHQRLCIECAAQDNSSRTHMH